MAAAFLLTVMNDPGQPMQDRIAAAGHLLQAGKHASRANQQMVTEPANADAAAVGPGEHHGSKL
ncbi:hypothetical protein KIH07_18585 [Hydrogenophaga taeniospiralis]|uniref:hypothetical protein n=1 Tax=Hydrogenophaga taeniospiralis TaxID=65656 RepID=UPI001CFA9ED3|nr:hypothetical protein [Hydrogenophaga taeniospiralis]MCB4365748.1 hypothetical protein [Hydrogenophaga taeniospiralis]